VLYPQSLRLPRVLRRIAVAAVLTVAAACDRGAPAAASAVVDDFGDTVRTVSAPRRIVSLNPTTTELLFAIGAGPRVVGRTTYDIFPAEVRAVPDLGPGLRPNVEAVLAAHPDLVLLYASADNREAARRLRASGVATAAYRIDRIADMVRVTRILGRLVGDTSAARRTVDSVSHRSASASHRVLAGLGVATVLCGRRKLPERAARDRGWTQYFWGAAAAFARRGIRGSAAPRSRRHHRQRGIESAVCGDGPVPDLARDP
jgi:ABC-type hemin transport system substrate-binding protein